MAGNLSQYSITDSRAWFSGWRVEQSGEGWAEHWRSSDDGSLRLTQGGHRMHHKEFKELHLDGKGLQTPAGFMPLEDIKVADFRRNSAAEPATPGSQTASTAGVVGGAVIGGVVAGPVGAVAGGLAGSTIKTDSPGEPGYARTVSATISFETTDLAYTAEVPVFDVEDAEDFVSAVRSAAGL